jgi:uncharacterized protein (TIGR04552 family)
VLRGGSIIDWPGLSFGSEEEARRFIHNHEVDPDHPGDRRFIEHVQADAVDYLRRNFAFAIPKPLERASLEQLLLIASGRGHRQMCACRILKTVHIINHMAGRELLFRLPFSDRDLFHLVEEKVYRVVGAMLSEGFPITEFVGGRKNLDSTYTKLLSKAEASALAIYDKLRFRIVTRSRDDYAIPQQATNTIFHLRSYCESHPALHRLIDGLSDLEDTLTPTDNRFTAPAYRIIQFVTEVPVRVPPHVMEAAPAGSDALGPVVYLLCEFQLLDAESEAANEAGEASHDAYKRRQREAVSRRLRLGTRRPRGPARGG